MENNQLSVQTMNEVMLNHLKQAAEYAQSIRFMQNDPKYADFFTGNEKYALLTAMKNVWIEFTGDAIYLGEVFH